MKSDLSGIAAALRSARSVLITGHTSPDGDAIGSMLGFERLMRALGCQTVACVLDGAVPRIYQWLPGAGQIIRPEAAAAAFDTAVILDASHRSRIGATAALLTPGTRLLTIDHHLDDAPEGNPYFLDSTYAATGEIVADLVDAAGVAICREAAECLYVALATDTGSFRYSNASARSHRTAARLIEAGLDVAAIAARVFDSMSRPKFDLLARVLPHTRFQEGGRIACTEVTGDDLNETGAADEDMDGLINFSRNVEGVDLAILIRQVDAKTVKASLRSTGAVNSAEIAARFGGGGHAAAAGVTLAMPMEDARRALLECCVAALRNSS